MYDTSAKLTFGVGEKTYGGIKSSRGRLKPKEKAKIVATFFLLFFGDIKIFVAPPPAKNPGHALGLIHIYLIELCYE